MNISKVDLLNKRFSRKMFGYSRVEVDQLLTEVAEVLGEAADERKQLNKKIKRLEAQVQDYRERDETLRDTLMSTQKMVDDIKASAGREAENIIQEARVKAESTVQKGHARLAQVHEEIELLKRQRTQFQAQLKALIETHQRLLEPEDPEVERLEELESKLKFLKKAE